MDSVVKAFQPSGILDGIQGNQLRREIISALEIGIKIVLVDFQNVTLMNSSGLGTLLAALRTARTMEGKIFICSLNEQVKMLFDMTKMERVFQIFNNQDEFKSAILSTDYRVSEADS